MDEIDRQLIRLLQEDASRPLKSLAAEVALSRSSVRDRIARLEREGVLARYTVEVSLPEPVLSAVLLVRLQRTPDPFVVRSVVALAQVTRCYSLSGDIDLLVEVTAVSTAELNDIRDRIARLQGVNDLVTALVLKREKA